MTSAQIAFRLLPFTGFPDFGAAPAAALLAILDAINGGLQDFYEAIPTLYRRTTVTALLPAPRIVSVDLTQDSFAATFTPALTDGDRGATISISGDAVHNTIVNGTTLLQAWTGASGTYSATIYGDAILPPAERIVRIVSAPVVEETRQELTLRDSAPLWVTRSVGEPCEYWTEPLAASDADPGLLILRVSPMPAVRRRIRFSAEATPAALTLPNLIATPIDLPVRPGTEVGRLLPLCVGRLLESPFFTVGDRRTAAQAAETAKVALGRLPAYLDRPANRVGTPAGF